MNDQQVARQKAVPADNCIMVIFGARGDLTKRLVVPALYNLTRNGLLPAKFALVGVDHGDQTTEGWGSSLYQMLESFAGKSGAEAHIDTIDRDAWNKLAATMSYVRGEFDDTELYSNLDRHLSTLAEKIGTGGNVLFYLAVADRFFGPVVDKLGGAGLTSTTASAGSASPWRRVVVEKPFGNSLAGR